MRARLHVLPAAGGFQLPNDRALLERLLQANGQPIEIPALQAGFFYAGDPTYKSPVGTFETLVYSSGTAAKVPTELRLESVNGDKTTFRVFESTALGSSVRL